MDDVLGYLRLFYRSQIRFVLNDLEVCMCRIMNSVSGETEFASI